MRNVRSKVAMVNCSGCVAVVAAAVTGGRTNSSFRVCRLRSVAATTVACFRVGLMRKAVETAVSVIFASTGLKAGVNENGLENCHQDSTMLKLRRFSR